MIEDTLNIYWKQTRFTLISCQNAPRKKPLGHLVFFGCYCLPSLRASPGAAVKLCLGDLLVMGSNPETASLHMQG